MIKRVMIVDDSMAARMMLKQYLAIVGLSEAEFEEAANGRAALDVLKKQTFDLIVTDMNMPVMNGAEFINHVKASPKLARIPIIIVSSAANKDNQERFMDFGVNHVIPKPVSPQLLHQAVSALQAEA